MPSYQEFLPSLRFRGPLAISPSGEYVAYIDDELGQFNIAVRPIEGGEPRRLTRFTDLTVRTVCWHPDGESLVFLADRQGDEANQFYKIDVAGGEPQPLILTPGVQYQAAFGEAFSPDGRWLAYAGNDRRPGEQDVLVRDWTTGTTRRLYADGGRVFAGYWSPDGRWLTALDLRGGKSDHIVYLLSPEDATVRRLTPPEVSAAYWLGPWLPDGSGFLVLTDAGRDFTELAAMDARTGELSWLDTPGWDVEQVAMSADGRRLVWSINVAGACKLRARDLSSGNALTVPDLPAGEVKSLALNADGAMALMYLSTPTSPANVATLELTDGNLQRLTNAAPPSADKVKMVEPQLVSYAAADGREIPAYLYLPSEPTGPIGVVLAIHGGPALQERASYSNDGFFQYLVSSGVAVFAPNIRGSKGYGMRYQKLSYRDWGGGDLSDLAEAASYLQRQPWADPTRIGVMGRSYGGFAALSCVARLPEMNWAAAVVWCGPSNLLTFTKSQPPTWRWQVATMVGDAETDAEFLLSRSPVTYADQIRAPLFLIQGANDPRVPRHESDQIAERLRARGVEVRYDVYPDEGHVFSKRENQIRARSSAGEFLLAHLNKD
jgi:dipeptidyl aminopeptidase/acylaminoacyl peptidase